MTGLLGAKKRSRRPESPWLWALDVAGTNNKAEMTPAAVTLTRRMRILPPRFAVLIGNRGAG
jgi:hypothetical protein